MSTSLPIKAPHSSSRKSEMEEFQIFSISDIYHRPRPHRYEPFLQYGQICGRLNPMNFIINYESPLHYQLWVTSPAKQLGHRVQTHLWPLQAAAMATKIILVKSTSPSKSFSTLQDTASESMQRSEERRVGKEC